MPSHKTRVANVNISGHNRIFRSYIEMRALCEAYATAKAVSNSMFRTGSEGTWADRRAMMENHKRSELRRAYEREVRQKLETIFTGLPRHGFGPYITYLVEANDRALKHRRDLDAMIQDEMEYARRDEKLYGILGKAAVITKFSADIGMTILGAIPGVGNLLTDLGYSAAQDAIRSVENSKNADVWVFEDTTKTLVLAGGEAWLEKGLEIEKASTYAPKAVKGALVLDSIYAGLLAAADDWRRFQ